jgi:hypothetical protein
MCSDTPCCKRLGVGYGGVRLNFPAWCRPTAAYARTSCEREPCDARLLMKGDLIGGWVVYPKIADSLSKFCTNRASEFLALRWNRLIAVIFVAQNQKDGSMNTPHRYQYGSLTRRKRIRTEDVWQFRYYETTPEGRRRRRSKIIGALSEYPTQADALRILERFRLRLNLQNRLGLPMTLDALADDYVEKELPLLRYGTQQAHLSSLNRWSHRLEELTQLNPAMSAPAREQREPGAKDHRGLAGSSLISTFRITSGWCSPASPTRVYERSNPWGPSTFISQLSFARDLTMDTRHSPATSLRTCSTPARISLRARGSPVFCISIVTAMPPVLYKVTSDYFLSIMHWVGQFSMSVTA